MRKRDFFFFIVGVIVQIILFLVWGYIPSYIFSLIFVVSMFLILDKDSKAYSLIPFVIMSTIPVLEEVKLNLSPKPELEIIINRIHPVQELKNENLVRTISDLNLTTFNLILVATGNPSNMRIILKRDILSHKNYFFGYIESNDSDLPYGYSIFIKNSGASTTNKEISGTVFMGDSNIKCVYSDLLFDVSCGSQNPFYPSIFFKTREELSEGDRGEFRFYSNQWRIPELSCTSSIKNVIGIYDMVPFSLDGNYLPAELIIEGEKIILPDYSKEKGMFIYDREKKEWIIAMDDNNWAVASNPSF